MPQLQSAPIEMNNRSTAVRGTPSRYQGSRETRNLRTLIPLRCYEWFWRTTHVPARDQRRTCGHIGVRQHHTP